jgi:hypothetical protein
MYARHYGVADDMLRKYAKTRRLRALDALHLGIAADCQKGGLIDRFVTSDALLYELAQLEGITTLNPVLAT